MSEYYNPNRSSEWNYGGSKWKLSRSKIELFLQCQKCFYLDNKIGIKRPPGFPFNLNTAVDTLLKKEFDIHRVDKTPHPLMKTYGVDAIPFEHKMMDEWRRNFGGLYYHHKQTDLPISGAVDDIWVNRNGELIVADYKATSKQQEKMTLDAEWQTGYKRQMEVYQWLLRNLGFKVSDTGYFVYCNGKTDKKAFDGKLEFDIELIAYKGDDSWVESTLKDIKKCLEGEKIPKSNKDCDFCKYRNAVINVDDNKKEAL